MRKKIIKILVLVAMITTLYVSTAHAGVVSFSFFVENYGQIFSENANYTRNTKVYLSQPWSIRVDRMVFSGSNRGYGMAYILRRPGFINTNASNVLWQKYTGASTGYWGSYAPVQAEYSLWGRMDDDLVGSCESTGYWNADYISAWF